MAIRIRVLSIAVASALLITVAAHAQLTGPLGPDARAQVVQEFVEQFGRATVQNAPHAGVNHLGRTQNVIVPSINLHPTSQGDSIVGFDAVPIPICRGRDTALLLFRIGMSDGIPWDDDRKPNGVRFTVWVNGRCRFAETVAEGGWRLRAVDLTDLGGAKASVQLRTNAIEGNTTYDWALFGRPALVLLSPTTDYLRLPRDTVGLAVTHVQCRGPATAVLSMGEARTRVELPTGRNLVPILFDTIAPLTLEVQSGRAELISVDAAPHTYHLKPTDLELDSPLVLAGRPFHALLRLKNTGEGLHRGSAEVPLTVEGPGGLSQLYGDGDLVARTCAAAPGEEILVKWAGLVADEPGRWRLTADVGDRPSLEVVVRPPEPALPQERFRGPTARVGGGPAVLALVGNPWCRLAIVLSPGAGPHGVLHTWSGDRWQRVGSLLPLARLIVRSAKGEREQLRLAEWRARSTGASVRLSCSAINAAGTRHRVMVTYTPHVSEPRIGVEQELVAGGDLQVVAFYGPEVLAGDKAFGAAKEFAIFPGLEYLEGNEPSSSARDLAPPLNDRRVPAHYKIATPLMAVQAEESLVALLWDASQEWTAGQRHPAARFLSPAPGKGPDYTHMSLFAPSVGEYVRENEYEARVPFVLQPAGRMRLACWLVADSAARHSSKSIVHGPHRGGLVLQAMAHWFNLFGLPEPSPQPRNWTRQRELSRVAYLETLWQDDPPGWPSHTSAKPEANVPLTAPLLLDLRMGVDAAVGDELQRRIDLVTDRSLRETNTVAPVHGNRPLLQFTYGYLPQALAEYARMARRTLAGRENGLWVWRPGDDEHAALGIPGTHALGQATYPSLVAVRAARYTGHPELTRAALEAMGQMAQYDVPRGASMWECPQYQPDLLAAALAIKAYCEAYRLTGDSVHLQHARYWAWTGLPFLYTWQLEGYPTMLWNSIGVMGSTYYTHSWIGRPVVWMGLDYAYALQDLAPLDSSFPWLQPAQGITNSALWQQYTDGPSKGCYPDSWEMADNHANPADINPILLMLNEFRLRGKSLEPHYAGLHGPEGPIALNCGATIVSTTENPTAGRLTFSCRGTPGVATHSVLAPVAEPTTVSGCGSRAATSHALCQLSEGWLYDAAVKAIVIKHTMAEGQSACTIAWEVP